MTLVRRSHSGQPTGRIDNDYSRTASSTSCSLVGRLKSHASMVYAREHWVTLVISHDFELHGPPPTLISIILLSFGECSVDLMGALKLRRVGLFA